jgi:UDP-N-acetylmuramyl pentapeptide phosphotransferase/UDP-N-acetylglucosamine-1-phosphate transferase
MTPTTIAITAVAALLMSLAATRLVLTWLERREILDQPNERSSHTLPTPKGGGIATSGLIILFILFSALAPLDWFEAAATGPGLWLAGGVAVLALVSWWDDLRGLPQAVRLLVHVVVVGLVLKLGWVQGEINFIDSVPDWAEFIGVLLIWVWFINLFNFMDGIDGLAGVEGTAICVGVLALMVFGSLKPGLTFQAAAVAGITLGFLWFNWHPARLFLGDVGSVPLGLVLGALLLQTAKDIYWAPVLVLPLYYWVDATLTLLSRILRGEKFWQSHRQHYYQKAVINGLSHARVTVAVGIANVALIFLAVTSVHSPASGIAAGAVVVFILLLYFKRKP